MQHRLSGVERTSHLEYSTDLATGVITPLGNSFNPHGLLFVPAGHHQNDDDHPEGED